MKRPEGFHVGSANQVCRYLCMGSSSQLDNGTRSYTLFSLSWVWSALNLTGLSISTPMERSRLLSPSTLMTLPLPVKLLSSHFKCYNLGPTCFLLGVAVDRIRSQAPPAPVHLGHSEEVWHDWLQTSLASQTCSITFHGSYYSGNKGLHVSGTLYLNAIGSLQYLAMMTCPDIAHAVAYLPHREHSNISFAMSYVKNTVDHKLTYQGDLMTSFSHTQMHLMVIVLILDALLLDMSPW